MRFLVCALPYFVLLFQVPQSKCTVANLKKIIRRTFELMQERNRNTCKISWKYIWKTYWLTFNGIPLKDNDEFLSSLGIKNKSHLSFVKRLRDKNSRIKKNR